MNADEMAYKLVNENGIWDAMDMAKSFRRQAADTESAKTVGDWDDVIAILEAGQ